MDKLPIKHILLVEEISGFEGVLCTSSVAEAKEYFGMSAEALNGNTIWMGILFEGNKYYWLKDETSISSFTEYLSFYRGSRWKKGGSWAAIIGASWNKIKILFNNK